MEIWVRLTVGYEKLFMSDELMTEHIAEQFANKLVEEFPSYIAAAWVVEM